MPVAKVQLPDGKIARFEVADGTTPEQVQQFAEQQFAEQPPKRQAGFAQRVSEAYGERLGNVGEALGRYDEQYVPETAFQAAGEGLGFVGDVLGNALISGYRYLPDSEYGLGEAASALGSISTGGSTTVGSTLGSGLDYLSDEWRQFESESPRAAANLRSAVNVGTALLPAKGALNVGGKVGKATGGVIKTTGQVLDDLIPKPKNLTSMQLRQQASKAYSIADDLGGTVKPNVMTQYTDDVLKTISKEGADLSEQTQKALRSMSDKEGIVRDAVAAVEGMKGRPLSLKGFTEVDQKLTSAIYSSGVSDDAARQLSLIQRKLRDTVENVKPDDLIGGGEGFEAYKRGRELWSKSARMSDLEGITKKAFATDQPTNSLKRALKRFLADDKNLKGFSAEEIEAISKASETGVLGNMARMVSGRLPASVGLAANPAIAPALSAASTGARNLSDDIMIKKINALNDLIATGEPVNRGVIAPTAEAGARALGTLGKGVEKVYTGGKGNLATLGTLQQLERERQRDKQTIR